MKDPERQAARWLRQARYDLTQAERLLDQANYACAAFFAEQAAQKALKAYLIFPGSPPCDDPFRGRASP